MNHRGVGWDLAETTLRDDWERSKQSNLHWAQAQHAARAAWHRVDNSFSGTHATTGPTS